MLHKNTTFSPFFHVCKCVYNCITSMLFHYILSKKKAQQTLNVINHMMFNKYNVVENQCVLRSKYGICINDKTKK